MQFSISPEEALIASQALVAHMEDHLELMRKIRDKWSDDKSDMFDQCKEELEDMHKLNNKITALIDEEINA